MVPVVFAIPIYDVQRTAVTSGETLLLDLHRRSRCGNLPTDDQTCDAIDTMFNAGPSIRRRGDLIGTVLDVPPLELDDYG